MKKLLCLLMAVMMLSLPTTAFAAQNISTNDNISDNVQYLTDDNYNPEQLQNFMSNGGIVVVIHDGEENKISEEQLGIPFSMESNLSGSNVCGDLGKDIVTLYYNYGDGRNGIYIINVGTNDNPQQDELIDDAISIIRKRQKAYTNDVSIATTSSSATSIGIIDVTTTREPKGKLNASYEVFTVQDYCDRDYYIVKSTLNGMPGCILNSSKYDSKYQGEGMYATIGSSTSSVTIDAYGPHRTVKSNSYTVEVGGSWSKEGGFEISGGWSWTRNIDDTDIEASCTTNTATWDITLRSSAQKTSFAFEPAVTFDCPSNKATVYVSVYASYDLDSWDTLAETIELSRTIKCNKTSAVEQ